MDRLLVGNTLFVRPPVNQVPEPVDLLIDSFPSSTIDSAASINIPKEEYQATPSIYNPPLKLIFN